MKLLLDTHAFIWWFSDPAQLSPRALEVCSDTANDLLVSVASLWEMQIKRQLGKLTLSMPLADIVQHQIRTNAVTLLPVVHTHVLALDQLPAIHKDPFDRLLAAQSISEGADLVTADQILKSYPVRIQW